MSAPPPRVDGPAKADGSATYAADAPGALVGIVLTSALPHARVRIGPGRALEVAGAVAVLGPQHAPDHRYSSNPHLTDPEVCPPETSVFNAEARFVGDVVGLVVAETAAAARRMVALVDQHEDPLPSVTSVADAEAPDAPLALEARRGRGRADDPGPGNVGDRFRVGAPRHEVEAALAAAPSVLTHTFTVEPGPIGALERMAALARWEDGTCHVRSSTQLPAPVAARLAEILGVDPDRVTVEPAFLGGGFGAKEELFLEPLAAVASRHCGGRAVLVEVTRRQLNHLRRRHGATICLRTGSALDGTPLARHVDIVLDPGAERSHSLPILWNAVSVAAQLYPAPVVAVDGRAVLTNTTPASAFRGYGGAEVVYAVESHVDELARHHDIEPIEYRRRHLLRTGTLDYLHGWPVASFAGVEALDALEARAGRGPTAADRAARPPGRWRRGRGLAALANVSSITSAFHVDHAEAACRLEPDGTVVVETGVVELGQGSHSAFAAIAADRLAPVPLPVRVEQLASATAPDDGGTFASRGIYVSGNAVAAAVDGLVAAVRADAARRLGVPVEATTLTPEGIVAEGVCVAFADLAPRRAVGRAEAPDTGLAAGAQAAEVAVDTWTGRVVVERFVSVHDVGHVIDPDLAAGQVVGGVHQGIGLALTERVGRTAAGGPDQWSQLDHAMPSMLDAVPVEPVFVTDDRAGGLLGAKGLGEATMVGVLAAVGNAVRDAVGIRLPSVPMVPEAVLDALDAAATAATAAAGRP